jgi:hypothetical protein
MVSKGFVVAVVVALGGIVDVVKELRRDVASFWKTRAIKDQKNVSSLRKIWEGCTVFNFPRTWPRVFVWFLQIHVPRLF